MSEDRKPLSPIVFPDARGMPLPPEPSSPVPALAGPESPRRRWGWRLLFGAVAMLVLVALGFDAWDLFRRAWDASVVLGVSVATLAGLAVFGLATLAAGELRGLLRLRKIDGLRDRANRILEGGALGEGHGLSAEIEALYAGRADMEARLASLRSARSSAHDDAELMRLLDRELMQPIDRAAYQEVLRASRDAAIGTAVSPLALIDLLLVLWRSLRMIRQIARLYGARPGAIATARLLKRAAVNAALAGGVETGDSMVAEALGGTFAAAVSTRLAQGLLNGLLTARLGLAAMDGCRPLPFSRANRPSLGEIRKSLLQVARQADSDAKRG